MSPLKKKRNSPDPKGKGKSNAKPSVMAKAGARPKGKPKVPKPRTSKRREVAVPVLVVLPLPVLHPTTQTQDEVTQDEVTQDGLTQDQQTPEGRYVYGIIPGPSIETFGKSAMGGGSEVVYTVHHAVVAAVVSRTSAFIFDPTRENALAHEHVIETVMKTNTIIPMSFGTVFRTDEDIKQVLKSIYPSLQDVLRQMTGKLEFGVKVTWDRDRVIEELKRDHADIHRFHMELTRKQLQSTYFARMQLGRMIDKALTERAAFYVREINDALRSICVASRDIKLIGDKMIMNAAFLLQREREPDFDAAVNKVAAKFSDRLNFKYTGPWPPYNFVNIRLRLERSAASGS